jgi:small subunit ribosomal protein S2
MTGLPHIVIVLDQQKGVYSSLGIRHFGDSYYFFSRYKLWPRSHEYNDDTMTSIRLILNKLVFAICEDRSLYIRNR